MYLIIILLMLGMGGNVFGQAPDTLWTRTYGGSDYDEARAVQQTTDGGYIVAGTTYSFGAGNADFYLVKTNSQGDTVWTRTYGGMNSEEAYSVQQTTDGGYVLAGRTSAGNYDFYLVKTNSQGDTVWTRTYGGMNSEEAYSVQQTTDGGYVLAGHTSAGNYDFYLVKTNNQGDTVWTRTYGGVNSEGASSVQQTADGGYIAAGYIYYINLPPGEGSGDINLVKTNSEGDAVWSRAYGGSDDENASSVQQIANGGYVVAGTSYSLASGYRDIYLLTTNSQGDALWTREYGGSGDDFALSVLQTIEGGFMVAGGTNSSDLGYDDIYLIRTSSNGDTVWTRAYGGSFTDVACSVLQTSDGGYVMAGYTNSFGLGYRDFYLVKTHTDPAIHITFPNGGETFATNSTKTIYWEWNGNIPNVHIHVYRGTPPHGTFLQAISPGTLNTGSFEWTVFPWLEPGSDYYIGIAETDDEPWDYSDTPFTIFAAPAAPEVVTWVDDGFLYLSWSPVTSATSYEIWSSSNSDGPYSILDVTTNTVIQISIDASDISFYYVRSVQ